MRYAVVIERVPESNYCAYVPDLPGCVCVWQLNLAHFGSLFWPTLFVDG